ncbi:MAG: hypothetical protein ACOCP4_00600 [Candidatus Woesearchaeota archaeon]
MDEDELFEDISKKCAPFIKNIVSEPIKNLLVSGRKSKPDYFIGTVRKNRKPKDTPTEYHEYADKIFYEEFGIKARSQTLFCNGTPIGVKSYGNPYLIFPIGKYKLV